LEVPLWPSAAWNFLRDPDNRTIIAWLCGGIAMAVSGMAAAVKFFAERKKVDDKNRGNTRINVAQGFGIVRGQTFQAPVTFGPSPHHIEQFLKPLTEQLAAKDAQIAALTDVLWETTTKNISEGAAEGDNRLREALDLLNEKKTHEAANLLEASAEDAKARAENYGKDAAIAYRDLGIIAGFDDRNRALEAFEKALALDPDEISCLLMAGYLQVKNGDLDKAQARFERTIPLAESGNEWFHKYWGLIGLGDIEVRRGKLESSVKCYSDALAVVEHRPLLECNPIGWQLVSVAHKRVGTAQMVQGKLKGALCSYNESLALAERFTKSAPGDADWQRDLLVTLLKIGDVQEAQGDLQGALKSYNHSITIAKRFGRSDPGNAEWQHYFAVSLLKVGDVHRMQGDLRGAFNAYSEGFAIIDVLAKSNPSNADWQHDLSISYTRLGVVQRAQGDLQRSLRSYSESLAIIESLAKSHPGNAYWQRDLAVSFGNLAKGYRQSGDKAKAGEFLNRGQGIIARLTKLSPDNALWKRDLAWFDRQIAELESK
jgi:tetratricopeptide (TPR) repeat protein